MNRPLRPKIPLVFLLLIVTTGLDTNVAVDIVEGICKQSQDYNFCIDALRSDRRSYDADPATLATIATLRTNIQLGETTEKIPKIASGVTDQTEKIRIGVCKIDYEYSVKMFNEALELGNSRSYWVMLDRVQNGTNAVIDCENIYRRYQPITVCPVTTENHNLIKLSEIVIIIVDGILQPHH